MSHETICLTEVLNTVFESYETKISNNVISGKGKINNTVFRILGTVKDTDFGVDEAIVMAKHILYIVKNKDKSPILLFVDAAGQTLEKRDEWLGMYAYLDHLLKCLHLVRNQGNKLISLVYNQSIENSYIAFGMMADRIYVLSHAKLAVMWLEGMTAVTKIGIDTLQKTCDPSPVFDPGVDNFKKSGGFHKVTQLDDVSNELIKAIHEDGIDGDNRTELGAQFNGRSKTYDLSFFSGHN